MVVGIKDGNDSCVGRIMSVGTWLVGLLFVGLSGCSLVDVEFAEWAALILIILAGIPHGSFDLRVAQKKWGDTHSNLYIVGGYLTLVGLMSALCLFQPFIGLLLFLAISTLHFSEGESADSGTTYSLLGFCTGVGAILIPIGLHLEEAHAYLGFFIPEIVFRQISPWLRNLALILCSVILLSHMHGLVRGTKGHRIVCFERLLCLAAWILLSPLAGFSVWFLGRHSRMHLEMCRSMFAGARFKLPLDFLVISAAAVVLLAPFAAIFDLTDIHQLFTATLALISGLTLPHIVVSYRLKEVV